MWTFIHKTKCCAIDELIYTYVIGRKFKNNKERKKQTADS